MKKILFLALIVTLLAFGAGCDDNEESCIDDLTDCEGRCVDLMADEANCGECGTACDEGESCIDGECGVACASGLEACDGLCVDLDSDEENCGECGESCGDGESCIDGECELLCPGDLEACDGECVDTNVDLDNCGDCDNVCPEGEVCSEGECGLTCGGSTPTLCDGGCVNTETDEANCGECDNACDVGEFCLEGECTDECVPSAEVCDGEDNDCDGETDEDAVDAPTWYADSDDDGFGDPDDQTDACEQPDGFVDNADDCDDESDSINPDANEICDGLDNDCNGVLDDNATDVSPWSADRDGDGFGDPDETIMACSPPFAFFVSDNTDCDDSAAAVNPEATEICDTIDNDCDGLIDDADDDTDEATMRDLFVDGDGDGYAGLETGRACAAGGDLYEEATDCDDVVATNHPGAEESCDYVDNDCDGVVDNDAVDGVLWYADSDGDTFGDPDSSTTACLRPDGYVLDNTDCDDTSITVHPFAWEVMDNTIDDDCDGEVDDADTDVVNVLTLEDDGTIDLTFTSFVFPFCGEDRTGGRLDSNGRFTFYADSSDFSESESEFANEGPSVTALWEDFTPPDAGTVAWIEYDDAVAIYYRGVEIWGSSMPNTHALVLLADGSLLMQWEELQGTIAGLTGFSCGTGEGRAIDVSDPPIARNAAGIGSGTEDGLWEQFSSGSNDLAHSVVRFTATAGVDTDGDGWTDVGGDPDDSDDSLVGGDGDGDGYSDTFFGGGDCDDANSFVNPGIAEACNGIDDDCDGDFDEDFLWAPDLDGDGYGDATVSPILSCVDPETGAVNNSDDCDDSDDTRNPDATEICEGAVDENCDGVIDEGCDCVNGDVQNCGPVDLLTGSWLTEGSCETGSETCIDGVWTGCDAVFPVAETCNDADDDCDGTVDEDFLWAVDADGDGYGDAATATVSCTDPADGRINDASDCDDTTDTIAPFAGDTYADGVDSDCDGVDSEAGWYDDSTYFAWITDLSVSWDGADWTCISLGYDGLASIRDGDEQALVTTMIGSTAATGTTWFGYSDVAEDGTWVWSDGAVETYMNWNVAEPNGGTDENCAEMYNTGTWNDAFCGSTRSHILCQTRL